MAHLLLLDVPGGNDFTVLEDAISMGHEVTFYTSDLKHYHRQGEITEACLNLARETVEIRPFDYAALECSVVERHRTKPFDAILCLIDLHVIAASRLAERLGLRFLNSASAQLMRDKFSVRKILAKKGIRQPRFALANTIEELRQAITEVGYPALVKPSDGYGSQNIFLLHTEKDFNTHAETFVQIAQNPTDYGLGIHANNRFLVEQYMAGHFIGCDVFSDGQARKFLGINDKRMFPPPSFAIRGSCFPSSRYDILKINDYVSAILDAVNFNFGAAHIEIMMTEEEPYLVEVNPRLVSAQIPYQMGYALERSIYADLINLHLGVPISSLPDEVPGWFSAIRWITANRQATLENIRLPEPTDPMVRRVTLFKAPGDDVRPPINNGDRLGYVIAVGKTQEAAEQLADRYVKDTHVELR